MQAQVKRRIVFGITTGGLLAGSGLGFAHADASGTNGGNGSGTAGTGNSPGILSGNSIQIPVDVPINVCGITANVLGLLNPAAGNDCSNSGGATASTSAATTGSGTHTGSHTGTSTTSSGGATAHGGTSDSPGILSGNNVQIPVHIPVNACGDTVNVVGLGNAALGNHCANGGSAATGGTNASTGGATAHGGASDSPGILSGNNVQIPVHIPVNACGDTVNVVGLKNVAADNHCANDSSGSTGATAHGGATGSPGIGSGNNVQLPIDVPVNVCGDTLNVVGLLDAAKHNECANGAPATPVSPPVPPSHTPPASPPATGPEIPPPGHPTTPGEHPTTGHSTTPGTPSGSATPGGPQGSTSPGGAVGPETSSTGSTGSLAHTGSDALMLAPVGAAMVGGGLALYRKFKPGGTH